MGKLLEISQQLTEQKLTVIPLIYQSKRPLIKWENYQSVLPTQTELLQWFPNDLRNIGLVTGNGLVVIDFDIQAVFDYWFSIYPLDTYMVKTRRGVHVYLFTDEPAKNYHSDLLDIKAERGYVLIPPSIHPSGYQYTILSDKPIMCVAKLEDVLPESFTPKAELAGAQYVNEATIPNDDPWSIADNANSVEMGSVAKIRSRISLLSLLPKATRSSSDARWFVDYCPFHHDNNPSFWIDTQRGMCGCRKCNIKEMDVIDLYSRLNNKSLQQSIVELSRVV